MVYISYSSWANIHTDSGAGVGYTSLHLNILDFHEYQISAVNACTNNLPTKMHLYVA